MSTNKHQSALNSAQNAAVSTHCGRVADQRGRDFALALRTYQDRNNDHHSLSTVPV